MPTIVTVEKNEHLERLLMSDRAMQKKVRNAVARMLSKARTDVRRDTRSVIGNDPRDSYKAVKRAVYKRILGGSISILQKRKAGSTRVSVTKDTTNTGRGGNRCKRSARTEQMDSYYGEDRGFILRFLENGTSERTSRYGNRGSISARGWFGPSSERALGKNAGEFERMVNELIEKTEV